MPSSVMEPEKSRISGAAALPHEAEDLAPLQGKGHVRGGGAVAVSDAEAVESEDRVAHVSASFASSASRTQSPR